jgi:hypothetical protein
LAVTRPEQAALKLKTPLQCLCIAEIGEIMQSAWKAAAITLLLYFSLFSHGQGPEAPSSSIPYTKFKSLSSALNGNWHLMGMNAPMSRWRLPFLSLAIEVDEDKLYGRGNFIAACQDRRHLAGGTIVFTGRIASDGTFEANADRKQIRYSIRGTMPAPGDTSWQGSYAMKNLSAESDCILDESGVFTATRYTPFTGTYSGILTHNEDRATGVAVTVQVTQGEAGEYVRQGYSIPLGGRITVFGVPCFTHGTATNTRDNSIQGDHFFLTFSTEDGALLHLSGERFFDESDESTIKDAVMTVEGGRCGGGWGGTLALR